MSNPVPGTTSLLDELDKKLMVLLRDGRTLIGYLRSIDQFANLVLHRTIERIHVGNKFGDIPRGIFIIRGENVVLCGEVNPSVKIEEHLVRVEIEEILELQQIELDAKQEKDRLRLKSLHESGLNANNFDFLQEDF